MSLGEDSTGKSCPVCGKLALDTVVGKDNGRSLKYYIEPSEQNRDLLFQWIEECDLCRLVYDLDQHWSEQGNEMQGMKFAGYNYDFACGRNGCEPLDFTMLTDWDSILINRIVKIAVHANPLSEISKGQMKHWIARCDTNDAECTGGETALPTRVLDVRDQGDIRLCETGGQSGAYIALSHCWGLPDKTFITTHNTIADMKAGFTFEQAPATFRDAISVTRLLGIHYLWIDSLCIIQYDTADWSREAAKMGSVYANAYLTIAAANAEDDNDGFLRPRSDALTSLRILSSTGNSAPVYLQTQDDEVEVRASSAKEPLDARGWALQEQHLSRRTLRFGSLETSWGCQCFNVNESRGRNYNGLDLPMRRLIPDCAASSPLSYHRWYTMVFLYTNRVLTYETDILRALSGLATEVAKFSKGTYYAGLWWEDMASGMLWCRLCAIQLNKPSEYLAPSWSWASLNGWKCTCVERTCVEQSATFTLSNVVFRKCYLVYKSDDPHGAVRSGWLDLSAPLVKLVQRGRWGSSDDDSLNLGFAHLDVPDIEMNDHVDDVERSPVRRSKKGIHETIGVLDLAHKEGTEIFGLFLKSSQDKSGVSDREENRMSSQTAQQDSLHWSTLHGILVKYPNKRQAYRRVGYFRAMRLEAGEALQILEGAEVKDIRLY